jgi:hypothetical protein
MDSFSKEEAVSISNQYEKKWQETPSFHSFLPSKGAGAYDPLLKPEE